jgi:hypothetical protein
VFFDPPLDVVKRTLSIRAVVVQNVPHRFVEANSANLGRHRDAALDVAFAQAEQALRISLFGTA